MVQDMDRLAALNRLGLLDTPTEAAFDRLTRLAARILKTPGAVIALVDSERQFFKSAFGIPEPWATTRQMPLSYSFSQYVVNSGKPFIIRDTRNEALLLTNLAISELNVIAYAGIPLVTSDGHVLGAFCVIDFVPRNWTLDEIEILKDLAAAVITEIELRAKLLENQRILKAMNRSEDALVFQQEFLTTVLDTLLEGVMVCDARGSLTFFNRTAAIFHGLPEATSTPEEWALQRNLYLPDGQTLLHDEYPLNRAFQGEFLNQVEMVVAPEAGPGRTVLVNGKPIIDDWGNKRGAVITLHDITDRKKAENERESLISQLQAALGRTEALYQSARSLNAIENLADLLQTVVDNTGAALAANQMTLVIMDCASKQIEYVVIRGPDSQHMLATTLAELNAGLTGWVLRTLQPAISPGGVPDPRESPAIQQQRRGAACGAVMVTPLIYRGTVLGTMTAARTLTEPDFSLEDLELMGAITNQAAIAIANATLFQEVQLLAMTDGLTKLYNRRGFFEVGQHAVERAQRQIGSLVAMMFDVDHFKVINDTYGHAIGDQVLVQLAECCQYQLRKMDVLGRYGGEEFAILISDTDFQLALKVAERLRACVEATPIQTQAGSISITISIGVASWGNDLTDLAGLLARADDALYQAKAAGRNCIRLAESTAATVPGESSRFLP
ncbi:MAG: diguanylate cyclase [Herpetosiphonaceae bacterium]|nr:diguanylate cyclase [Herpetosiphonaceae bacterium]